MVWSWVLLYVLVLGFFSACSQVAKKVKQFGTYFRAKSNNGSEMR